MSRLPTWAGHGSPWIPALDFRKRTLIPQSVLPLLPHFPPRQFSIWNLLPLRRVPVMGGLVAWVPFELIPYRRAGWCQSPRKKGKEWKPAVQPHSGLFKILINLNELYLETVHYYFYSENVFSVKAVI